MREVKRLVLQGYHTKNLDLQGVKITLRNLSDDETREVTAKLAEYGDSEDRIPNHYADILSKSIISVDGRTVGDDIREELLELPFQVLVMLYREYRDLLSEYDKLVEKLPEYIKSDESKIMAKVLLTMGWSPRDKRVQELTDVDWFWLYGSIVQEENEKREFQATLVENLMSFTNPEMYRAWKERVEGTKQNTEFDTEIKEYLIESGVDPDIIEALDLDNIPPELIEIEELGGDII